MKRQWLAAAAAVPVLLSALSACGSDAKPEASPTSTATPSVTPTPTPTPTPAGQPSGADGVTLRILNWDAYASNPAVLAYKRTNEAIGASINSGEVLPEMRAGLTKKGLRTYVPSLNQAKKLKLHVSLVGKVKVSSAKVSGSQAKLVVCAWTPSIAYRYANDKLVATTGKSSNYWAKQQVGMRSSAGNWKVDTVKVIGKCPGGEPA